MYDALAQARHGAQDSRTMNRLQRSFASARIPNAKNDSTVWVFSFLTNAASAMLEWIKLSDGQREINQVRIV